MRLLHTSTFKLHSFFGDDIPPYAILSHRWGDTEVLFQDVESENGAELARANVKIAGCCGQAAKDEYEYVWIDSCCIDKSSSAELSEAINSMFRWYQDALMCYVYLSDVNSLEEFRKSAWFERGWTLQELLAPKMIVFYDQGWNEIGTKATLEAAIESVTNISHLSDFSEACIAQKMSWASHRKTTRVEDEAYCLMGLFNVNMPILYGEGSNAFIRLQEEIIKKSDDESIFAWTRGSRAERWKKASGMLAASPEEFSTCSNVIRVEREEVSIFPYEMTNKGIRIQMDLIEVDSLCPGSQPHETIFSAPLRCKINNTDHFIAIRLRLCGGKSKPQTFHRIQAYKHFLGPSLSLQITEESIRRTIYIKAPKVTDPYAQCSDFLVDTRAMAQHKYQTLCSNETIRDDPDVFPSLISSFCLPGETDWVAFQNNPNAELSALFLSMTSENGRPGIQLQALGDHPPGTGLPRLQGPPLDRATLTLESGHVIFATARKMHQKGLIEAYHVDLMVILKERHLLKATWQ
ncbi:hypothetical protein VTL71DRAFT_6386 [Oculimacula yallundae]|uniref:Heterokaryon incompatibility domain-containing protein n=1 Tax=Oculimacula yallundae TaxID=86028 RepID=A0ABR4BWU0_9HELO